MTHWFVGQKVVCIDDDWRHRNFVIRLIMKFIRLPRKRGQYIISALTIMESGRIGLKLWGFNPAAVFLSDCFRPLVETKTDISIFTSILDRLNAGQPVEEDVRCQD